MPKDHFIIKIHFDLFKLKGTRIKTNVKKDRLEEILETWLSGQSGQDKDSRTSNKKSAYEIEIKLNFADDTFLTESDTGNRDLTCGIVASVLGSLDKISVSNL
jgi:hypothetical protein